MRIGVVPHPVEYKHPNLLSQGSLVFSTSADSFSTDVDIYNHDDE